jgi:hypothetical protein
MGGVISGDKQNTNANKKITSRVVIVRSKIFSLDRFGLESDVNSGIILFYFDATKVAYF